MAYHLRDYLLSGRLPTWVPGFNAAGQFEPQAVWYTNSRADVDLALHGLGQASDYEAGRTDSAKAGACAAIVASEVSTMLAKSLHKQEVARQKNTRR